MLIFVLTFFDIADKIVSYTTAAVMIAAFIGCELLTKSYHIQLLIIFGNRPRCCELLTKSYHIQLERKPMADVPVVNC